MRTVLRTRPTLRSVIILRQSDQDIKFEVFRRLNTGGVRLNAQEVRNNSSPGPLNVCLFELSKDTSFRRLLRIEDVERSALYQEMRDVEFVLRYLTFRDTWETFDGGMERHMDEFMSDNRDMAPDEIELVSTQFRETLQVVEACFDGHCFQRWMPEKSRWRRPVLASLFDAQMFSGQQFTLEAVRGNGAKILNGMQHLFKDRDFRRAIDAATNTPSYFRSRIRKTHEMIQAAVS